MLLGITINDETTVSGLIADSNNSTAVITFMMTSVHSVEPTIISSKYIF